MPQLLERSTLTEEPDVRERPDFAEVAPRPPFTRWLGWLLVTVVILGGAGLIWYGIANTGDDVATAAPAMSEIDVNESPEAVVAAGGYDTALTMVAPPIEAIDPHQSPEITRVPVVNPFANPRIP